MLNNNCVIVGWKHLTFSFSNMGVTVIIMSRAVHYGSKSAVCILSRMSIGSMWELFVCRFIFSEAALVVEQTVFSM